MMGPIVKEYITFWVFIVAAIVYMFQVLPAGVLQGLQVNQHI